MSGELISEASDFCEDAPGIMKTAFERVQPRQCRHLMRGRTRGGKMTPAR
jgi:hypothetical protein